MGKIISQFDKHVMYTALLTAAEPSDVSSINMHFCLPGSHVLYLIYMIRTYMIAT